MFPLNQLTHARSPKPAFLLNTFSGVFRRLPVPEFPRTSLGKTDLIILHLTDLQKSPRAENLQLTNHLRPCIPIFCSLYLFRKQIFSQLSSAPIFQTFPCCQDSESIFKTSDGDSHSKMRLRTKEREKETFNSAPSNLPCLESVKLRSIKLQKQEDQLHLWSANELNCHLWCVSCQNCFIYLTSAPLQSSGFWWLTGHINNNSKIRGDVSTNQTDCNNDDHISFHIKKCQPFTKF